MTQTQSETAFHAIVEAGVLKKLIAPPVELANDKAAKFRWSENHLQVCSVDGAQVMMVDQIVRPSAFESYEFFRSGEVIFGTACGRLAPLLKTADDDTSVDLKLDDEAGRLDVRFNDVSYSLGGVDTSSIAEPNLPDLEFSVQAQTHSSIFKRSHNIIGSVSDVLTFEAGDGSFRVHGSGDIDTAEIAPEVTLDQDELQADGVGVFLEEGADLVSSQFSDDYIRILTLFLPDDYSTISLSDDLPLRIETRRANARISTEILIAPRLDESS